MAFYDRSLVAMLVTVALSMLLGIIHGAETLEQRLISPSEGVRQSALEELEGLDINSKTNLILPIMRTQEANLQPGIDNADLTSRVEQAVRKMGPDIVPYLIQMLREKDEKVRWYAALALGYLGPEAGEAVPALIENLSKDYPDNLGASQALRKIGTPEAQEAHYRYRRENARKVSKRQPEEIAGQREEEIELTEKRLSNAEYYLDYYPIVHRWFQLENGTFSLSPEEMEDIGESGPGWNTYQSTVAFGDLNNDAKKDAAVILVTWLGGTGYAFDLAVVINQNGRPYHLTTIGLGDRVEMKSVEINSGIITIRTTKSWPENAPVTLNYKLSGNSLVQEQ